MNIGESIDLGPYTVRAGLRHDNPAFPCYLVFRADKLIGKSFSLPDLGCCKWLERSHSAYAAPAKPKQGWVQREYRKHGRPSNAEKARREAYEKETEAFAQEIPAL